jgi:integrase
MMPTLLESEEIVASTPLPPRLRRSGNRLYWRSRWYDDAKQRHDKVFGESPQMTERQALAAYKTWLQAWHRHERIRNPHAAPHTYTAQELARDYLEYAKATFRKGGEITSHVYLIATAMNAIAEAFGDRPASSIEAHELANLRDAMVHAEAEDGTKRTLSVKTINGRLTAIKSAYQWARERGMVTREAALDLATVKRLQPGRSPAVDPKEIQPIDEHWVSVTKDRSPAVLQAMIDLQWLTGMRPGEVCMMRGSDIDTSGDVWLYIPQSHKTEHKGKSRVIPLGPRAQEIVARHLKADTSAYLFSPADAAAEMLAQRRAKRKTPMYPSHQAHRTYRVPPAVRDHYTTDSYRRAIEYACRRARAASSDNAELPDWNPNQLRHAYATRVRRQFGLEAAADGLGHAAPDVTTVYAQRSLERAKEIAAKVG